jgi:hypothetical protein
MSFMIDDENGIVQTVHLFSALQIDIHERNRKWWYDQEGIKLDRNKGELLALVHSEISECLEGVRKNCMDDHLPNRKMEEVELADAVIRILDYAEAFSLNVGAALIEKLRFNETREDHKIEAREKANGKKF